MTRAWPGDGKKFVPVRQVPGGRAILLVDDDAGFVQTLGALMTVAGYSVTSRYSHGAAVEYLGSHSPDVLITDLRLGNDGDGWSLARHARTLQPELPIIIVTGWSYSVPSDTEFEAIPVFVKPFDPDGLIQYLNALY